MKYFPQNKFFEKLQNRLLKAGEISKFLTILKNFCFLQKLGELAKFW